MKKYSILLILLIYLCSLNASVNGVKLEQDTAKYNKLVTALSNWNLTEASQELKIIAKSNNPKDEAYFYFFKANILLYTSIQTDSISENPSLPFIDSAVKYFEKAQIIDNKISFNRLYINNSNQGLDTCASIVASVAKRYYLESNYLQATKLYERAVDIRSDNKYLIGAGLSAMMITSYYKAEKYFQQALILNSTNEKVWIYLTETYKRMSDTTKALICSNESVLKNINNVNILLNYFNISVWSNSRNEINHSIHLLDSITKFSDIKVNTSIGLYFLSKNNFDRAEKYYLSIANKKTNTESTEIMMKFYYNWFLYESKLIYFNNSKGNSKKIIDEIIINKNLFLKNKISKYLKLSSTNQNILDIYNFLNLELNN
jgi:hypothetical protein